MTKSTVKYLDIYQEIKARILANKYSSEQKLPDGKRLAQEFDCSELTIKKSLDILVKEGYVVRKRGSGSFVKRQGKSRANAHLHGTKNYHSSIGQSVTTKIIHFSAIPATQDIANKLHCQMGELVYNIIRVRVINKKPQIIEYTYMPVNIIPNLSIQHIEDSIYGYIQQELRLKIHSANMNITVVNPEPVECEYLELTQPEKLVNVEQTAHLDNGQLFEYSIAKHLWDTYEFSTTYVRT